MATSSPVRAINVASSIPTGPATRLIPKGGANPAIFTIIGCFNTCGKIANAIIKLKRNPTTGSHLVILLEISPSKGVRKASPKGTAIKSTGFTFSISFILYYPI